MPVNTANENIIKNHLNLIQKPGVKSKKMLEVEVPFMNVFMVSNVFSLSIESDISIIVNIIMNNISAGLRFCILKSNRIMLF